MPRAKFAACGNDICVWRTIGSWEGTSSTKDGGHAFWRSRSKWHWKEFCHRHTERRQQRPSRHSSRMDKTEHLGWLTWASCTENEIVFDAEQNWASTKQLFSLRSE